MMMNVGWLSRLSKQRPSQALFLGMLVAMFLAAACLAVAQNPANPFPTPAAQMSVPNGYAIHESIDMGGRYSSQAGSGSMYDTMVNLQSGPRVLGETFELHALPGTKNTPLDDLRAFASGFGGDPNNFAKLDFSKAKWYEFSGTFRRDRQYFDYDLLGNPGIPTGYSIPISGSTTSYAWPQVNNSPFLFNTVRRMTDTSLTLLPLSRVTYRFAYSQNIMQGPSLTPSGNAVAGQEVLLEEFQRNSTDDFTGAIDWKPVRDTKFTFEEQIDHYRGDSYFNMDPAYMTVQEADGTRVALLSSYQSYVPYGYSATGVFAPGAANGVCNGSSMINSNVILYNNPNGGPPIIDPACNVISSYIRRQPTREIFPTEIFRFQSSSLRNISMNGDVRYTHANMNLPYYYEDFQGLQGTNRELSETASANARREVMAADYGIVWQASKTVSLSDQVNYSNVRQPGSSVFNSGTTISVPATAGDATINYTGLTSKASANGAAPPDGPSEGSASIGTPFPAYFGQRFATNNATVSWDATPRMTFSFTYRYQYHLIAEGQGTSPHNIPIPANNTNSGEVTIHENGGVLDAALRPSNNWTIDGSFEAMYNDNAFTPMGFRQLRHYRVHTIYRPKAWATVSGAFNDLERHNNTNNNQSIPGNTTPYYGPMDHVDHSRIASVATELFPNDRYGLDINYTYNDVYLSVNGCFQSAATLMPGGGVVPGIAFPNGNLCAPVTVAHGSQTVLAGPGKDFEDAPTQFASVALTYNPVTRLHSHLGYRISSVNGSRFFTDTSDVNGSLVSTDQTPFVQVSWTVHPGLIWNGEYDYFGYGEGGRSGAQYCNANPNLSVGTAGPLPVTSCSSIPNTAMYADSPVYGFTAPRNFHANNMTLGIHWEF